MLSRLICRSVRVSNSTPTAGPAFSFRARKVSTLPNNPHIGQTPFELRPQSSAQSKEYVFEHPLDTSKSILSLLPTSPPAQALAIGTASSIPPTSDTFTENPQFLGILQSVFHAYATHDPDIEQQAAVFASPGGFNLGATNHRDNAGAANQQGGMGGANRGGWIHVSDTRNPPDWGRIAWPEDMFGSLEVDGEGRFVDDTGNYQTSGTYRIVTREGILGITPFLREKLVQRLRQLESEMKK